jgi:hypothetical protein
MRSEVLSRGFATGGFWRIVLKKSFWGDDQNFLGPLMHFARGDVRGHIAFYKNCHRPPYRR